MSKKKQKKENKKQKNSSLKRKESTGLITNANGKKMTKLTAE